MFEGTSSAEVPNAETLTLMSEIEACQDVQWATEWMPRDLDDRDFGARTDWIRFGRKSNEQYANHPGFSQIIEWQGSTVEAHVWTFLVDEKQLEYVLYNKFNMVGKK